MRLISSLGHLLLVAALLHSASTSCHDEVHRTDPARVSQLLASSMMAQIESSKLGSKPAPSAAARHRRGLLSSEVSQDADDLERVLPIGPITSSLFGMAQTYKPPRTPLASLLGGQSTIGTQSGPSAATGASRSGLGRTSGASASSSASNSAASAATTATTTTSTTQKVATSGSASASGLAQSTSAGSAAAVNTATTTTSTSTAASAGAGAATSSASSASLGATTTAKTTTTKTSTSSGAASASSAASGQQYNSLASSGQQFQGAGSSAASSGASASSGSAGSSTTTTTSTAASNAASEQRQAGSIYRLGQQDQTGAFGGASAFGQQGSYYGPVEQRYQGVAPSAASSSSDASVTTKTTSTSSAASATSNAGPQAAKVGGFGQQYQGNAGQAAAASSTTTVTKESSSAAASGGQQTAAASTTQWPAASTSNLINPSVQADYANQYNYYPQQSVVESQTGNQLDLDHSLSSRQSLMSSSYPLVDQQDSLGNVQPPWTPAAEYAAQTSSSAPGIDDEQRQRLAAGVPAAYGNSVNELGVGGNSYASAQESTLGLQSSNAAGNSYQQVGAPMAALAANRNYLQPEQAPIFNQERSMYGISAGESSPQSAASTVESRATTSSAASSASSSSSAAAAASTSSSSSAGSAGSQAATTAAASSTGAATETSSTKTTVTTSTTATSTADASQASSTSASAATSSTSASAATSSANPSNLGRSLTQTDGLADQQFVGASGSSSASSAGSAAASSVAQTTSVSSATAESGVANGGLDQSQYQGNSQFLRGNVQQNQQQVGGSYSAGQGVSTAASAEPAAAGSSSAVSSTTTSTKTVVDSTVSPSASAASSANNVNIIAGSSNQQAALNSQQASGTDGSIGAGLAATALPSYDQQLVSGLHAVHDDEDPDHIETASSSAQVLDPQAQGMQSEQLANYHQQQQQQQLEQIYRQQQQFEQIHQQQQLDQLHERELYDQQQQQQQQQQLYLQQQQLYQPSDLILNGVQGQGHELLQVPAPIQLAPPAPPVAIPQVVDSVEPPLGTLVNEETVINSDSLNPVASVVQTQQSIPIEHDATRSWFDSSKLTPNMIPLSVTPFDVENYQLLGDEAELQAAGNSELLMQNQLRAAGLSGVATPVLEPETPLEFLAEPAIPNTPMNSWRRASNREFYTGMANGAYEQIEPLLDPMAPVAVVMPMWSLRPLQVARKIIMEPTFAETDPTGAGFSPNGLPSQRLAQGFEVWNELDPVDQMQADVARGARDSERPIVVDSMSYQTDAIVDGTSTPANPRLIRWDSGPLIERKVIYPSEVAAE